MRVKLKALLAVTSAVALSFTALAGCNGGNKAKTGELTTIVIGTHAQQEDDPNWVDEITGEPAMNPDYIRAAEKALGIVEDKLGVKVTWSQYSSDLQQLLLQTVLAGDPYCDLAVMWNGVQGNIMGQNILQNMKPYMEDVFWGEDDADKAWIPIGETFGGYYLLNRDLLFVNTWPICYNVDYIEAVPDFKTDPDGTTAFPSELYERGEWTWSTFEWYLERIEAYYRGKKSPVNASKTIVPFNTNYSYLVLMAIASNGAAVFNGKLQDANSGTSNLAFDSPEAVEAIEFVDRLVNSANHLISCSSVSNTSIDSGWLTGTDAFCNGETVFTCVARWQMDNAGQSLASRGQSMAIIPFPRPDDLPADSKQYHILSAAADSVGLMKGIDPERSKLALEAYATYKSEYYKAYANVDSIEEYRQKQAGAEAMAFGVDILHPEIGDANLRIFQEMGNTPVNDYSEAVGVFWTWTDIAGRAIYNYDGSPKYATAVRQNKTDVYTKLDTMSKSLNDKKVVDEIAPTVSAKDSASFVFELGTDPDSIDWQSRLNASDNFDGQYEIRREKGKYQLRKFVEEGALDEDGKPIPQDKWKDGKLKIELTGADFNTAGHYDDGVTVTITDNSDNKNTETYKFDVFVYDDKSTEPPVLKLKESLPTVGVGTDTSGINWGNDFVETATDVNGIDLKSRVSANVRKLDVTVPGKYDVEIYVKDFAGNETTVATQIEVK